MANYPTNGDDVIYPGIRDVSVDGLGGDDHIVASRSGQRLYGNTGDDRLATDLWFYIDTAGGAVGAAYQNGGAGADLLEVSMRFEDTYHTQPAVDFSAEMAGGAGADQLSLEMIADAADMSATMSGGDGDDLIVASMSSALAATSGNSAHVISASGGAGNDVIRLSSTTGPSVYDAFGATLSATGGAGADTLVATTYGSILLDAASAVTLDGGSGADVLRATVELRSEYGVDGDVHLIGGDGNDRMNAVTLAYADHPAARNLLDGGDGNDTMKAVMALLTPDYFSQSGNVENRLNGGAGNDTLTGEIQNSLATGVWRSVVDGGAGADTLRVIGGQDNVLRGGPGQDQMWGGDGADRFVFLALGDSTQAARDSILGFGAGDRIGVAAIDAGAASGDQAFDFTGTSGGAGDLWVVTRVDDAVVIAETELGQRLVVRVADAAGHDWTAGDFLL
ncbi:MAG: hypothetical protein DI556_04175 [Rhodovulum sulfidophilum]|uniref:Peptidase M10 serralysin C-terminal domain-containing protein n=1 Tax=Rhodovulum sulfidophilum TaxID=35806 RepID=A0A2W5NCY5_RHOSU|nr:MAG: hypothetical protein DI556_04175 [Rhodovulum sulfidophilum]